MELYHKAIGLERPAYESLMKFLGDRPQLDVEGPEGIVGFGFAFVKKAMAEGLTFCPRWERMNRFTRRLVKTPYRFIEPRLRIAKLAIHIDSYGVAVGHPYPDVNRLCTMTYSQLMYVIRWSFNGIMGFNPPRFSKTRRREFLSGSTKEKEHQELLDAADQVYEKLGLDPAMGPCLPKEDKIQHGDFPALVHPMTIHEVASAEEFERKQGSLEKDKQGTYRVKWHFTLPPDQDLSEGSPVWKARANWLSHFVLSKELPKLYGSLDKSVLEVLKQVTWLENYVTTSQHVESNHVQPHGYPSVDFPDEYMETFLGFMSVEPGTPILLKSEFSGFDRPPGYREEHEVRREANFKDSEVPTAEDIEDNIVAGNNVLRGVLKARKKDPSIDLSHLVKDWTGLQSNLTDWSVLESLSEEEFSLLEVISEEMTLRSLIEQIKGVINPPPDYVPTDTQLAKYRSLQDSPKYIKFLRDTVSDVYTRSQKLLASSSSTKS